MTAKESAVAMWNDAVENIPEDCDHREFFEGADIHDSSDRSEIEELLDHELPAEDWSLALADAFDDLQNHFGGDWW